MRRLTVFTLGPLLLLAGFLLLILLLPLGLPHRNPLGSTVIRLWLRSAARLFGVRMQVSGAPAAPPVLFVANHISWLDIPVLGGLVEASFLAKAEVRRWPVIGFLAARTGTLFIERGRPGASEAAIRTLSETLRAGRSVVLFPEARTSEGTGVRRFHSRLFQAAIDSGVPVQPVAIRYLHEGRPDPLVPFVDGVSFLQSVWRVSRRRCIEAQVTFFEPIDSKGRNRHELANEARAKVASAFPDTSAGQTPPPKGRKGEMATVSTEPTERDG